MLPKHPTEVLPFYELYPFPPQVAAFELTQFQQYDSSTKKVNKPKPGTLDSYQWGKHYTTGPITKQSNKTKHEEKYLSQADILNYKDDQSRRAPGYHGRHWSYMADTYGGLWKEGLDEFIQLAIPELSEKNVATNDYSNMVGYLPIATLGRMGTKWKNNPKHSTFQTSWIPKEAFFPTYEMRASYRAQAIALWDAVRPNATKGINSFTPSLAAIGGPKITDTTLDCDRYEYDSESLSSFQIVLPQDVGDSNFPPHPAQIMALSYLAHAASMCASLRPPWNTALFDDDIFKKGNPSIKKANFDGAHIKTESFSPFWNDRNGLEKDCAYVSKLSGASVTVNIPGDIEIEDPHNDVYYYAGDYIWMEEAPNKIFRIADHVHIPAGTIPTKVRLDESYEIINDDVNSEGDGRMRPIQNSGGLTIATHDTVDQVESFVLAPVPIADLPSSPMRCVCIGYTAMRMKPLRTWGPHFHLTGP